MNLKIILILASILSTYNVYAKEEAICKSGAALNAHLDTLGAFSKISNAFADELVSLTPEIADSICISMVALDDEQVKPQAAIKKNLLRHKVISKDATKKDIGNFLNKNFQKLNCKTTVADSSVKAQHLYQRAFDGDVLNFFYDVVLEEEYEIDINAKFPHNGQELTLLDHINYILKTPKEIINYNEDTLNDIRDGIIEMGGLTGDKV